MRNKNRLSLILVFLSIVFLNIPSLCSADNTAANKITDLSDRKYEQALIELFDNAKESIVVSMYGISPGTGEKNPVRLLKGSPRTKTISIIVFTACFNNKYVSNKTGLPLTNCIEKPDVNSLCKRIDEILAKIKSQ